MTTVQAILTVLGSLVIPFLVQAIKDKTMPSNVARWLAISLSLVFGLLTALAAGVPKDASAYVSAIFSCVGGVQIAYTAFKAVGVTDRWLDSLLAFNSKDEEA